VPGRTLVLAAVLAAVAVPAADAASSRSVAAAQVALRAQGHYAGPIDGVRGPLTASAIVALQKSSGLAPDGVLGPRTRRALGVLGRPKLGQRELWIGRVGWDVSVLEFTLRRFGLPPAAVDGRFDRGTADALRRYQEAAGLVADGIAGRQTFRALARPSQPSPRAAGRVHVVEAGESFFSIAQRYHVSPWQLARDNGYSLARVIVPGTRLRLPSAARAAPLLPGTGTVGESLDRWAQTYGVDPRLARALAWMESGFQQDVVSSVGAVGVMQLLPETWDWVDEMLIGQPTPRTADGNVQAGVRYLRWQLDQFGGDVSLALAGWFQGARAVRERGLFDDTKEFVSIVLALYGKV
jgi:LysM repeat protein